MEDYKGAAIVTMRSIVKEKGNDAETAILKQLNPEESELYKNTLAFSWINSSKAAPVIKKIANVLYNNDPLGIYKLGKEIAAKDSKGIYKFLMRFTTIPFIVSQTAKLWNSYYKKGEAYAESSSEKKQMYLNVKNYPELPEKFNEMVGGYVAQVIEMTGGRNVKVVSVNNNPNHWKWNILWE
ncbi:hypothetical protein KAR34_14115 [bacterium]|nr:hypothetical protein [bacterium]